MILDGIPSKIELAITLFGQHFGHHFELQKCQEGVRKDMWVQRL